MPCLDFHRVTLPALTLRSAARTLREGAAELWHRPAVQVPALDALRSFAILLVVFHHWAVREYEHAGGVKTPLQDFVLFYYGWSGVDLFFVLSGFLIGKQLWRELDRTGTIRFGRFIMRRGLRIWPIYYAIMGWYALFSSVIHPRLSDWLFLSNYMSAGFARGWTLSTEEQFYIAVPLLLLLLRKRVSLKQHLWVLLGIEFVVLINRHFTIERMVAAGASIEPPPVRLITPFHLHLEGLLAGLLIALLAVAWPHLLKPSERLGGFSVRGFVVFVALTAVAFFLRATYDVLFTFLVLGLIYGGATYYALLDRSILTAPLRWRIWYPISRLSYSMYLNHFFIWPRSNVAIVEGVQGLTSSPTAVFLITMLIGTALSALIAAVMFVLIEHPFLLLRDRVLQSTRRAEPLAEAAPLLPKSA